MYLTLILYAAHWILQLHVTLCQGLYSFIYVPPSSFLGLALDFWGRGRVEGCFKMLSLCSPGWPGIHHVDQVGLQLTNRNPAASASHMLQLKACTTTFGFPWFFGQCTACSVCSPLPVFFKDVAPVGCLCLSYFFSRITVPLLSKQYFQYLNSTMFTTHHLWLFTD